MEVIGRCDCAAFCYFGKRILKNLRKIKCIGGKNNHMKRIILKPIPVKTNGTIAAAIESYRKLNLPMRKLLTDYLIVLSKHSELKAALNPWRDYHIGRVRGRIETGVSVEETA